MKTQTVSFFIKNSIYNSNNKILQTELNPVTFFCGRHFWFLASSRELHEIIEVCMVNANILIFYVC